MVRRRAPIKGTVAKALEPTKPQQVTFGGFILDNDGNAEAEDRTDDDDEVDDDDDELSSTDNEDGDEISEGPMLLFEEASLLPGSGMSSGRTSSGGSGGGSGSLAKRQREATLLSPRPQARRMLQRFAALVQASGARTWRLPAAPGPKPRSSQTKRLR